MPELTFLGTSNAFGHLGRHTSCFFISGSHHILVDAGYSLLSAVRATFDEFPKIDAILISHLHPDHYMGLPQMVLENYYVIKRDYQIPVFGPIGTEAKIKQLVEIMYNEEVLGHVDTLFQFNEYPENSTFEIPGGRVNTIEAGHSGNARMQIINFDGKTIGYTGDTSYIQSSIEKILSCDLSIIEATSFKKEIPDHITAQQLMDLEIPQNATVYISHLGQDVRWNKDKIKPPLYLADDGLKIQI